MEPANGERAGQYYALNVLICYLQANQKALKSAVRLDSIKDKIIEQEQDGDVITDERVMNGSISQCY